MTRREALLKKMKEDEAFLAEVLAAYTNDYTISNIKAIKLYLESNSICYFIFGDREEEETLQSPSNVNNKCILLNIFENMQIEDLAKLLVTISPLSKFPSNSDKIYQINYFNGDEYNMRKQFTDYNEALMVQIKYLNSEYRESLKNKYTHIIEDFKKYARLYDDILSIIQTIIEDPFPFSSDFYNNEKMIPLTQEEINSIKAEAVEFNRIILYHISRTKCHFEELYDYISRVYNMKALKYLEIEIFSGKSNQIISKDDLRNLKILKELLFAFMNDNIDSFHISDYI